MKIVYKGHFGANGSLVILGSRFGSLEILTMKFIGKKCHKMVKIGPAPKFWNCVIYRNLVDSSNFTID